MSDKLHQGNDASSSEGLSLAEETTPNSLAHTVATLAVIIIPFLGVIAAMILLWQEWFFFTDIVLGFVLYVFTALGVTVGFHRLLTHRSFDTGPFIRRLLTIAGSCAVEGTPTSWVADHRRHHRHSDEPGDPYSPNLDEGDGLMSALQGAWHAHVGWLITMGSAKEDVFTPDLLEDDVVMSVDRNFFRLYLPLSFGFPAFAGFLLTGLRWQGLVTGFVWAGLVRIFLTHHITWSVNSICHMFGRRPFESGDLSTNNWLLAIPTMGEAWHHNHHTFPTSAFHGLTPKERMFDPSGWVIWTMEKLDLAWNVKRINPEKMDAKRRK